MKKTQQQIKQRSGTPYHHSLDEISICCLMEAQEEHRNRGSNFSQGVLVRRALRHYRDFLKCQCSNYELEVIETRRAAKGVL